MAPYKLVYFNARGRAEPIRLIFAYAGQQYEDVRLDGADWGGYKSSMPCRQDQVSGAFSRKGHDFRDTLRPDASTGSGRYNDRPIKIYRSLFGSGIQ